MTNNGDNCLVQKEIDALDKILNKNLPGSPKYCKAETKKIFLLTLKETGEYKRSLAKVSKSTGWLDYWKAEDPSIEMVLKAAKEYGFNAMHLKYAEKIEKANNSKILIRLAERYGVLDVQSSNVKAASDNNEDIPTIPEDVLAAYNIKCNRLQQEIDYLKAELASLNKPLNE